MPKLPPWRNPQPASQTLSCSLTGQHVFSLPLYLWDLDKVHFFLLLLVQLNTSLQFWGSQWNLAYLKDTSKWSICLIQHCPLAFRSLCFQGRFRVFGQLWVHYLLGMSILFMMPELWWYFLYWRTQKQENVFLVFYSDTCKLTLKVVVCSLSISQ